MAVDYVTQGIYTRVNNATLGTIVAFPTTPIPSGEFLVIQFAHSNNAGTATSLFSVPAPWIFMFQENVANARHFLYGKIATGGETGNVSIGFTAVSAPNAITCTVMHRFTGIDSTLSVTAQYESPAVQLINAATAIPDADVLVNGSGRLVCNFGFRSASFSPTVFTGQSNGTWVLKTWGVTAAGPMIFLQTASDVAAGNTIGGGQMSSGVATGLTVGAVRGFAILPFVAGGVNQHVPNKMHHYMIMRSV